MRASPICSFFSPTTTTTTTALPLSYIPRLSRRGRLLFITHSISSYLSQPFAMPPKKATGAAAATKKSSSSPAHASYKDMIKDAIINLKERNGSSRQAIKKYVKANNSLSVPSEAQFDSLFNKALKTGVEKGEFTQPKGPSGPVKLAKKESKPAAAKPAVKKEAKPKAAGVKKEAKPKAAATKKAPTKKTTVKKTATKKTETKAKANTAKPRTKKAATATKTEATAPAVTEPAPPILKKTKSGRVSKQKAPAKAIKKAAAAPAKKAAPKKAAAKKA